LADLLEDFKISSIIGSKVDKRLGIEPSQSTTHDNSWQEESSWHPNAISRNSEEIPCGSEDKEVELPDLIIVLSKKSSNRTALSVEVQGSHWVKVSLRACPRIVFDTF